MDIEWADCRHCGHQIARLAADGRWFHCDNNGYPLTYGGRGCRAASFDRDGRWNNSYDRQWKAEPKSGSVTSNAEEVAERLAREHRLAQEAARKASRRAEGMSLRVELEHMHRDSDEASAALRDAMREGTEEQQDEALDRLGILGDKLDQIHDEDPLSLTDDDLDALVEDLEASLTGARDRLDRASTMDWVDVDIDDTMNRLRKIIERQETLLKRAEQEAWWRLRHRASAILIKETRDPSDNI